MRNLNAWRAEISRAWGRQFCAVSKSGIWLVPTAIACVVFGAFLGRPTVLGDRFICFATMFGFWLGMFNACQIINGAVASGEWNAWVLGLRRSFFRFYGANTVVSAVITSIQCLIFIGACAVLDWFYGESSLWQTFLGESNLVPFLSEYTEAYADCLTFFVFAISMMLAAVSGVAIGAGISCWAKDLRGALKIAVGVAITAIVTSFSVLTGNGDPYPAHPPLFLKFKSEQASLLSSVDALRARRAGLKNNAGILPHTMEDISLVLPQRYFFNIGRLFSRKVLDDHDVASLFLRVNGVAVIEDSRLFEKWKEDKLNRQFKYDIESLNDPQLIRDWRDWATWSAFDRKGNSNPLPQNTERFNQLLVKIAVCEMLACCAISAIWFFAGYWRIRNNPSLYELH